MMCQMKNYIILKSVYGHFLCYNENHCDICEWVEDEKTKVAENCLNKEMEIKL